MRGIERGFFQRELADAAARYQHEVESGTRTVVGVNQFQNVEPRTIEMFHHDPSVAERQTTKLKKLRAERDSSRVDRALSELRLAAESSENLVPPVVDAVRSLATLGEVIGVLRSVMGEYQETCVY